MAREPRIMERTHRLIADAMLGKLAKWLRVLGFDVAYDRSIENQVLVRSAKIEGRDILTRDRRLVQRRWGGSIRFIVIEDDHLPNQLQQVVRELGRPPRKQVLSRCLRCNEPLTSFRRKEAAAQVSPYVHRTQKRFFQCPSCRRIYWRGTHQKRILNCVKTLLAQDRSGQRETKRETRRSP
ncbi:MAG: Mut7-C RNAse domain-containing protein [Nitrospirae bacterium]|nr:Mut7-C RNAse domain-containing protein [Nitrospirota bacterium]